MSVPIQNTVFTYTANGATTSFRYECYVIAAGDISVYLNDVLQTSGYVVNGVGNVSGGDVVFIAPPAAGTQVRIERDVDIKRDTQYQVLGDFRSPTVNNDFDRIWMVLQRVAYFLGIGGFLSRVLRLGDGDINGHGAYRAQQNRIRDLADPRSSQDAVNLRYLQQSLASFSTDGSGQFVLPLVDRVIDTIAGLRSLSSLGLSKRAFVEGYYTPGDGGGGHYWLDHADTTSSDNGGTVIVANDGGRWKMATAGWLSAKQFGAVGDGVADDTGYFADLEEVFSEREIDLGGATYLVSTIPTKNIYHNGKFKVGDVIYAAKNIRAVDRSGIVSVGKAAGSVPDSYVMPYNQFGYNNAMFAAGNGAMAAVTKGKQSVAIGPDSQGNSLITFNNISIGEVSLQNVQSDTDQYSNTEDRGTRNIGIGGNSLQFLTKGRRNIAIGRNAATGHVLPSNTVAIGASALFGFNVSGWREYVENFIPNNNTETALTAIGYSAGMLYSGTAVTFVGYQAGMNMKTGDANTFVGDKAGRDMEVNVGWLGYTKTTFPPATVPYTKNGNNVIVTLPGHNAVVGGRAHIYWRNDGPAYASHNHAFPVEVTAVAGDTFTVECPYDGDGSGTADVYWTTSLTQAPQSRHNTVVGHNAAMTAPLSNYSVVIGSLAAQNAAVTVTNSTIVGANSARSVTQALSGTTTLGYNALQQNTGSVTNTTAIGYQAGLVMQDGSVPSVSVANSTIIGANASVSGNNQVQLGNSATTTYVYGTVQNRSDLRDKTDIRDTQLGLSFIEKLRPVDFRWDYRDDYVQINEDGTVALLPKDGSKKRVRFHHGLIAQEVKAVMDELGIEFGGYQDHTIRGGCDVQTIGYDELIAPIVRAVQELAAMNEDLRKRVAALEQSGLS